jgi:membrane protein DedA with SNARE-associated domain
MGTLLANGSMLLVCAWLLVGGLGIPLPEDAALLAAGVLVFHHAVPPVVGYAGAFVAVIAGDVMLFLLARRLGPAAYERRLFRRLMPPARRQRFEDAYRRHGGRIVVVARHVAGMRAATFALAGIHGMPLRRFVCWDALAACVSVPLVITVGYVGALHVDRVRSGLASAEHFLVVAVIAAAVVLFAVRRWRRR